MKKLNLNQNYAFFNKAQKITSILLIIVCLIFIVSSCTKETELSKEEALQLRTEMTPEQIVAAFTPVVGGTFNPANSYTGQEAVLGVETVLNYQYDDFRTRFDVTYSQWDTFTVNKINGMITDQVVANIYAQALQLMKCHYASIQKTTKMELFVDIFIVDENNSQLMIGINNVVGSLPNVVPSLHRKAFVEGDNWKAIQGKCDVAGIESNAPIQIANYVNWNLVGLPAEEAGVWFSHEEFIYYHESDYTNWFRQNPNDPSPGDYIIDYFQWRIDGCNDFSGPPYYDSCSDTDKEIPVKVEDPNTGEIADNPGYIDALCINWNEMNYYLVNAENEAKKYETILNKKFLNIEMDSEWTTNFPEDYVFWWSGIGKYAKRNKDLTRVILELGPCN